jgi:hypothetical protein
MLFLIEIQIQIERGQVFFFLRMVSIVEEHSTPRTVDYVREKVALWQYVVIAVDALQVQVQHLSRLRYTIHPEKGSDLTWCTGRNDGDGQCMLCCASREHALEHVLLLLVI